MSARLQFLKQVQSFDLSKGQPFTGIVFTLALKLYTATVHCWLVGLHNSFPVCSIFNLSLKTSL